MNMSSADEALRSSQRKQACERCRSAASKSPTRTWPTWARLTGLEELIIGRGFHLTDNGISQLSGLKRLRILDVDHSKMTDAGLEAIGKLTNLEELRIGGEGFSDRGLAALKGLTRLKDLRFTRRTRKISMPVLVSLLGMNELEHSTDRLARHAMLCHAKR